ncbi:MAG: serine/threonine protein kinase [Sandaracinaceae bacterium]|jgi:serine/threonine protein kinase|nr:serine/threonine protein kinase [Sandaracinaceae bacterium]
MADAANRELPRNFGKYLLFDRIGAGGMAEIYLARVQDELGGARRMVIKEILPQLSADEGFAAMLIAEAKLAAQLRHANVVQVVDLGREEGRLYIAMEYVEGFDLNALLRRLSKNRIGLPFEFALLIVREVLAGLDYAHRAKGADGIPLGIVHRDLSPSNVLISMEGEVKLCDFGIARALGAQAETGADASAPRRSHLIGKSAYMSPEHARGETVDSRADVFAAGILLWELSAGRRLYKGNEEQMLAMAQAAEVPKLPNTNFPCQEDLQAILDKALTKDRAHRYASAAEMMKALDAYIVKAKQFASQLKFGSFLVDHFADEVIGVRGEREITAQQSIRPPVVSTGLTASEPATAQLSEAVAVTEAVTEEVAHSKSRPGSQPPKTRSIPAKPASTGGSLGWLWITLILGASALVGYFLLGR